jgi:hypothetical protein
VVLRRVEGGFGGVFTMMDDGYPGMIMDKQDRNEGIAARWIGKRSSTHTE